MGVHPSTKRLGVGLPTLSIEEPLKDLICWTMSSLGTDVKVASGCLGQFNSIWHLLRGIVLFGELIRSRLTRHENSKLSLLGILSTKASFTYINTAMDYVNNMLYNQWKLTTWLRISTYSWSFWKCNTYFLWKSTKNCTCLLRQCKTAFKKVCGQVSVVILQYEK